METLRTRFLFWFAVALALAAMTTLRAAPNTMDLTGFKDGYRGTSKVITVAKSLFVGRSKMRFLSPESTAGELQIRAQVKAGSRIVPVNNMLFFASDGSFHGRELAPGATKKTPFFGTFVATKGRIDFQGLFKLAKIEGTFSGTLTRGHKGRLSLTYSVFVNEAAQAAYIYTYRGE